MAEIFDITSNRRDHTQIDLLNNENTWLKAQNCSVAPSENYNLVNKAYVDELFEIKQQGTPTSITVADIASKSVTTTSVTKTVTKSYSAYSGSNGGSGNLGTQGGIQLRETDTFTYGVTFSGIPTVITSNSDYYKISSVSATYAKINVYHYITFAYGGGGGTYTFTKPAGTVTATGQISSTTTVNETVTFTKSFGVVFKDIPTITNIVNCTVSDITTSSCTVTVPLSGSVTTGSTVTLSKDYSFIVNGNV